MTVVAAMDRQRYGRRIALSAAEIEEFLRSSPLARVATTPRGAALPHVTPLWFVWDGEAMWLYSLVATRRWRDWTADGRVAVVVDDGDSFGNYRGLEITGTVTVVGPVPRRDTPDATLEPVERALARKYNDTDRLVIDGRHAWVRVEPETIVSWDFAAVAAVRAEQVR